VTLCYYSANQFLFFYIHLWQVILFAYAYLNTAIQPPFDVLFRLQFDHAKNSTTYVTYVTL